MLVFVVKRGFFQDSFVIIIMIIKKRLAMKGRERTISAQSVQRPQPNNTNIQKEKRSITIQTNRMKEEKGKTVGDMKRARRKAKKRHWPALEIRQSRTTE